MATAREANPFPPQPLFGKVTSGDMALRAFGGRSADVRGRFRRVTSTHPRQNRLGGLLADVTLPETDSYGREIKSIFV